MPRITREEVDEQRGRFVIEPLDRGFGYTFGNSLRRVLLSSLDGAAITSVKIESIAHEFTTLPGVREDVIDIILNLKNLICRLRRLARDRGTARQEGPRSGHGCRRRGAGRPRDPQSRARDRESRREGPARDDDHDRARPWLRARRLNRGLEHTIGVIPVDSIFSPVRRVSYEVEAARVGQRTDYDKLTLDVTTDGSLDPRTRLPMQRRSSSASSRSSPTSSGSRGSGETVGEVEAELPQARGMENFPIEELELGVRSYNCLKRVGIETIGDLVSKSETELAAIPNFGKKSIEEVKETLAAHGLSLRDE